MKQGMICLVAGALALGGAMSARAAVNVTVGLGLGGWAPPVVYQPDPYLVPPPVVYLGGNAWGGDRGHDHRRPQPERRGGGRGRR